MQPELTDRKLIRFLVSILILMYVEYGVEVIGL